LALQVLSLRQINFVEKQMQKFAIAIGLLLSLLFLTGSGVNAEAATLCFRIRADNAAHSFNKAGNLPEPTGIYTLKAS